MRFFTIALLFVSAAGSAYANDYTFDDMRELISRATKHCANNALISKDKDKYYPKCQSSHSKGWASAHNCKGKSYLCVQSGVATCYTLSDAQKRGFENGECFK